VNQKFCFAVQAISTCHIKFELILLQSQVQPVRELAQKQRDSTPLTDVF
jgi:hypothetical protein